MKANLLAILGATIVVLSLGYLNALYGTHSSPAMDNNFEPHYTVFHGHTYITIQQGVTIHDPDCEDRDLKDVLNAHDPVKKVRK